MRRYFVQITFEILIVLSRLDEGFLPHLKYQPAKILDESVKILNFKNGSIDQPTKHFGFCGVQYARRQNTNLIKFRVKKRNLFINLVIGNMDQENGFSFKPWYTKSQRIQKSVLHIIASKINAKSSSGSSNGTGACIARFSKSVCLYVKQNGDKKPKRISYKTAVKEYKNELNSEPGQKIKITKECLAFYQDHPNKFQIVESILLQAFQLDPLGTE